MRCETCSKKMKFSESYGSMFILWEGYCYNCHIKKLINKYKKKIKYLELEE